MEKLLIIIFSCLLVSCLPNEIRKNKGITNGRIINMIEPSGGGYQLLYEYKVNDSVYENFCGLIIHLCKFRTFEGKYFPVVYSKKNPEKSLLLILPEDFKEWGYEFPDSLNWVKDCVP